MRLESHTGKVGIEYAIPQGQVAHLSFETGHLYLDGIAKGSNPQKRMRQFFRPIVNWIGSARESGVIGDNNFSTCFMVDDYGKLQDSYTTPQKVLSDIVLPAAAAVGLQIDYIVREGGCARLADKFMRALPGLTTEIDTDPALQEIVWLSSHERLQGSKPPQSEPYMGSMRMDIELSRKPGSVPIYSCPFLAAIFQNLRLGLLRDPGNPDTLAHPIEVDKDGQMRFGDDWGQLPVIMQLNPAAPPFEAFNSFSYLSERFLDVENAVRVITNSLDLDQLPGSKRIQVLANAEGFSLHASPSERRGYAFK